MGPESRGAIDFRRDDFKAVKKSREDKSGEPTSGLAGLLALGLNAPEQWTSDELEAALDDEISSPMEFNLVSFKPAEAGALRARVQARGLLLKSLRELLLHAKPPLELLVMAKDYFKANVAKPQPGLPEEVARALYYLTIAAAWSRYHQRITSLADSNILTALGWVARQVWVDKELRALATSAAAQLRQEPPRGKE